VEVDAAARLRYLLWEGRPSLEAWLQTLALLALAGVVLGVATRACCAISGLLLYHLAPLETLFFTPSPWSKGLTLPVLGLLTLSVTRCGERLALLPSKGAISGSEDGWALRLVRLFVSQQYFFSGWAKLAAAGWSWASAENIRGWLLLANLDDQLVAFGAPGLWVADRAWLCLLMGVSALTLDLGFVAAPFSSRARRLLVPAALFFHLAVLVTLNYAFLGAPLLLLLVDWRRAGGRSHAQGPSSGSGGKSKSSGPATGVTASPS
jgi:hypothetical protein